MERDRTHFLWYDRISLTNYIKMHIRKIIFNFFTLANWTNYKFICLVAECTGLKDYFKKNIINGTILQHITNVHI